MRPRTSLRQGLDRDVYQVVRKLEDDNEIGKRLTLYNVYDAIKRSNSSLARMKRRQLEDVIERILDFRKEEVQVSEDSDDQLDRAEEVLAATEERYLLNRQLTKHWHTEPGPVTSLSGPEPSKASTGGGSRKRKLAETVDPAYDGEETAASESKNSLSTTQGPTTVQQQQKPQPQLSLDIQSGAKVTTKKAQRVKWSSYEVERITTPPVLGGVASILDNLAECLHCHLNRKDIYRAERFTRTRGIIVTGPPGTGKGTIVRAAAMAAGLPLLTLNCFDDPDKVEKGLMDALEEAKVLAPCVVLASRIHYHLARPSGSGGVEGRNRCVAEFAKFMRKISAEEKPILVVGTTSRISEIDPLICELLCDGTVKVPLPDTKAREDILRALTEGFDLSQDFDIGTLARSTHGFVGADLRNVIKFAQQRMLKRVIDAEKALAQSRLAPEEIDSSLGLWISYNRHPNFESAPLEPLTHDDMASTIRDYVPLTRQEGFSTIPATTWAHVGALSHVRDTLRFYITEPIINPTLFIRYGVGKSAGVLLWGPPGCGKTLVARAVANEAQASFIAINGPELLNKYVGESERAVRELFSRARVSAPCILFFDEMDSLVPRRDGAGTEASTRVVNALLTELDGVQERDGVFVIGTTNRPDMIDDAMLRPGRLDTKLFLDLPTDDERVEILKAIFRAKVPTPLDADVLRLGKVARDKRCGGFSGADLRGLHVKAAEHAIRREQAKAKARTDMASLNDKGEEVDVGETGETGDTDDQGDQGLMLLVDWEYALNRSKPSVRNPEAYRKLAKFID